MSAWADASTEAESRKFSVSHVIIQFAVEGKETFGDELFGIWKPFLIMQHGPSREISVVGASTSLMILTIRFQQ